MSELVQRIGFGLIIVSMAFLVFVFLRAFNEPEKRADRRYRLVAGALAICALAVGLGFTGRLSSSFGGPPLHPAALAIVSCIILISSSAIICSTAIGGSRATLKFYLLCVFAWASGCTLGTLLLS
jgi:hypothetical protein